MAVAAAVEMHRSALPGLVAQVELAGLVSAPVEVGRVDPVAVVAQSLSERQAREVPVARVATRSAPAVQAEALVVAAADPRSSARLAPGDQVATAALRLVRALLAAVAAAVAEETFS